MAQIAEGVATQLADDAENMVQSAENLLQKQGDDQSSDDDQSLSMSAPSESDLDPMQIATSMLPDEVNDVFQSHGNGGQQNQDQSQNQMGSLVDEGEDMLDQGINMGMSLLNKG